MTLRSLCCASVLLWVACSAPYSEGRIACESASDCPSGWACEARNGAQLLCFKHASDAGVVDASDGGDAGVDDCTLDPTICDNGQLCDGVEICDPSHADADPRGCVDGPEPSCDDHVICTTDSCSADDNKCNNVAPDADGDGYKDAACVDELNQALGDDCDDDDGDRHPGNEEDCDDHDEDCDPLTFGSMDFDGDGAIDDACLNTDEDGTVHGGDDCNDHDLRQRRAQIEVCDSLDNDCDDAIDEEMNEVPWYRDSDGDNFGGLEQQGALSCYPIVGASLLNTDCDDDEAMRHPAQLEICDGTDSNCDGDADTALLDCHVTPSIHVSGGLISVSGSTATGTIRLLDHGFEYAPRSCGMSSNQNVCVTGGLAP